MRIMKDRRNCGIQMIEIGILIMIANFLTAIFIWQSILNGWKIDGDGTFFFHALVQKGKPQLTLGFDQVGGYISFLGIIFSFLGNRQELVIISNLILQFLGVGFFYGGVRFILGPIYGCLFALISAVCSVMFFPVTLDLPMHLTWSILSLFFFLFAKALKGIQSKEKSWENFMLFLMGGIAGILLFYDFTGIFLVLSLGIFSLNIGESRKKSKISFIVYAILGFLFLFLLLLSFLYSSGHNLLEGIGTWYRHRIFFYHNNYQMKIGFISIGFLFFLYFVVNYVVMLFQYKKRKTSLPKAAEEPFKKNNKRKEPSLERPLMEQLPMEQPPIKEMMPSVKLLENPLPLPKKHVKKVMNYAFEPTLEQMHYDLNNYDVNDDYDLK